MVGLLRLEVQHQKFHHSDLVKEMAGRGAHANNDIDQRGPSCPLAGLRSIALLRGVRSSSDRSGA